MASLASSAAQTDPAAVLLAPGILSPRKITVKDARFVRVTDAMALRATLECDLSRQ
jgi:hypothetical protein